MKETHCPLCHHELELRDVAPCDECGAVEEEIAHFKAGRHTYSRYEIFPGLSLQLCNFCDVDFGSRDPAYFGLPRHARIGYQHMQRLDTVDNPRLDKDKYCPACKARLAFLRFVHQARERYEG